MKQNITNNKVANRSGKPYRTLADGMVISWRNYQDADLELHAFFRLNRLSYPWRMMGGAMPIPLDIVFKPQLATSKDLLKICAHRCAAEDFKVNNLLPLDPKQDLVPAEYFYAMQGQDEYLAIRLIRHEAALLDALNCLQGRKSGWTLLGVKSKKYLIKLMNKCLSGEASGWMQRTGTILSSDLLLLLARRQLLQRGRRVAGIKSRTAEERSKAGKKGWKNRKKVD